MLSRLLEIPKVIFHELSGNVADENTRAYLDPEAPQELDMDINNSPEEEVVERLAYTEQLVVELKEIIRQKDEALQEEIKASDKKTKEMKRRARAKLTAWRKHGEETKAQERTVQSSETQTEESFFKFDKSSTEMEEFVMMKKQLQEKEKFISILQGQLSQTHAEQAAQSSSMQQVVREKDAHFETQVRLHEDELLQLVTQAHVETVTEETIASLQKRVVELENEKGALLLSSLELEELKSENEKLSSQITNLKAQNKTEEADSEVYEISMITTIPKKSSSSTEESGQDVLESTFSQNHKELSVLLLEMKEPQEEIAFLKSQLQGEMAAGHHEIPDQKEVQQVEGEGIPPAGMQVFLDNTAQDFPLVPNEESSVPVVDKEEQASTELQTATFEEISLNDTGIEMKSSEQGDAEESPSAVPDVRQCHQEEVERLKSQILELETSFRKAEEIYEKNSDKKAQEISSLTQLIEEFKKNAEDTSSVLTALSKERDQLLSQVKELNVLSELRAQVKQLETNLAEAERQRRSDYESQTTQHNLFTEQIGSLRIEAKSKDVTIEALQKELDDVQLQFSKQCTLMQSLQSQLQKKEREVLEGAERVRGISSKMEELSQALSQKELDIAQMDQLLLEKKRDVETLQQTIEEKDQQVTEVTFSMTQKMVQLTEEKFSLSVEIKTLKEQLNLLSRAEEAKKEQVQGSGDHWKPELEEKILELEKEKEFLQKKLQGALISRKAILKKAQEKERHLREELKQQKDDYNRLQEQFDEQSKENEDIEDQLKQLQIQLRESRDGKRPGTDQQELHFPAQGFFQATDQYPTHPALESDLCPRLPSQHGGANTLQGHTCIAQIKAHLKEIEAEKDELKLKVNSTTSELTTKSEEVFELKEQINEQILEIQSLKAESHETEAHTQSLKQKLESSQLEIAGLEHLRALQPKLDELQNLISQKEEEVSHLSGQLSEKEKNLTKVQKEVIEQEDLIKALHTQLEMQAKEHEGRIKQLQVEICELKQKPEEIAEENKAKKLTQRKLQAALISQKEALKTNKGLQEELSLARDTIKSLTKSLADVESQVSTQNQEKDRLLGKLALLQEERDRLNTEMDRCLLENQNLSGSCESLKLALDGLTEDKENLVKETESLRCSKIAESTEWQEKYTELQKEHEILLQFYENVSNEAERIQHVVETVRQEKQELFGKLRTTEANKKVTKKQLQEFEQEMEGMKEKMRKFAKSKQQEILELEEENDQLRAEAYPEGDTAKEPMETLLASNSNKKEGLERVKTEYKTLSKEFEAVMAEKDISSVEVQDLKHQVEDNVSKQANLETTDKPENQQDIIEGPTQPAPGEGQGQCSQSVSTEPEGTGGVLLENRAKLDISENCSSHDEINNYLQQLDQFKERIAELEEKQKDKEFSQSLEDEKNAILSQISGKNSALEMLQEEETKINLLNQQIQEDLSRVTKLKETAEEEKDDLEERLMNQFTELNGSIGNYCQDVRDAQIKNELEKLLSQEEEENIVLEEENKKAVDKTNQLMETLKSIKKENIQQKAQLDSFIKSESSLQNDRDHIESEYQQLEERHLSIILEKGQLIQEAAAENNKFKEEIRGLRSHMGDLNSENAKLDAELIQYREDLSQVISIKDSQQMQLLEEELRHECAELEENLKESKEAKKVLQMSSDALQKEKQGLCKEIENLKISISQLNRQEDTLGMYHAQLKVKEEEVPRLSAMLSSSQKRITEVEEKLVHVQKEATRKVGKIEDKLKKELKHLHHDVGIMQNEAETAEERVAELARDLVEMEQKLLVVTKESKDLTAQIYSFGRSMNSLQNSRDHTNEKLDELKRKYDASLKELAQPREQKGLLHREGDALLSQTAVHLNSTEEKSLSGLEKLNQQLTSKDEQLLHLASQLEDSYNQVQAFSKATTSLQNERDHLWSELEKSRKSEDGKQRSAAQPVSSPAQVQGLKKAMSSLQNDRDRLLKESKSLQQQYLQINQEITELRPLKAQLQEYQDKTKTFQIVQEELRQDNFFWQHELHQLRVEKNSWEIHERRMKEQYLMAISDKDQQLNQLQTLLREFRPPSQTQTFKVQYQRQASPQTSTSVEGSQNLVYETELLRTQLNDSLKGINQKELRIQRLNSKFSQLLEEKNTLSIQLSDTSWSPRETRQHYSDLLNHCAVLEKQVQEPQVGLRRVDVAPGAPQEKNGVHRKSDPEEAREPRPRFSETQQQLCNPKQEVDELRKLLEEERDQRTAAEKALALAEEQRRRPEWCWTEAGSAVTPSFPAPSATFGSHLLSDDSCPTCPVLHRTPINLVCYFLEHTAQNLKVSLASDAIIIYPSEAVFPFKDHLSTLQGKCLQKQR